ncbi:hypothetical protein MTY66_62680 (plasmid) [Mycolicibacterium sp. TY66]|uniref:hypothetical protein n=1 Tax=unclassified Mycolicibacterium TaxID=2636767 RepID=UPI001BB36FE2|nr:MULTISPECIES: hypothetical protein [unclassified Mycolicibacterium]BCI84643.1 hypothetical protein MTY66_62680 [Mycolicibacterium sp. TY66]BCJ84873.1 hypothetical protein MTY81_62460 [Mycolicibacterium sp. TY81]
MPSSHRVRTRDATRTSLQRLRLQAVNDELRVKHQARVGFGIWGCGRGRLRK